MTVDELIRFLLYQMQMGENLYVSFKIFEIKHYFIWN